MLYRRCRREQELAASNVFPEDKSSCDESEITSFDSGNRAHFHIASMPDATGGGTIFLYLVQS